MVAVVAKLLKMVFLEIGKISPLISHIPNSGKHIKYVKNLLAEKLYFQRDSVNTFFAEDEMSKEV